MAFDPITAALDFGGKLIDKLVPDATQAAALKTQLLTLQENGVLAVLTADSDIAKAQAGVDQVEASSASKFVSWWRPMAGWVAVCGFAYEVILGPVTKLALACFGYDINIPELPPNADYILSGMLGLGHVSRSVEKYLRIDTK